MRYLGALLLMVFLAAPALAQDLTSCSETGNAPYVCSTYITNAAFDWANNELYSNGDGDIWPIAWGPDDGSGNDIWTSWGDGDGWDGTSKHSFGFASIENDPGTDTIVGHDISEWCISDAGVLNSPPSDSCTAGGGKVDTLLTKDGNFFMTVQQQDTQVNSEYSITLGWSGDEFVTINLCNGTLFPKGENFWVRGAVMYGKDYLGGDPDYFYYLVSGNQQQDDIYIMRVPIPAAGAPEDICDTKDGSNVFGKYEVLSGPDADVDGEFDGGTPTWSSDQDDAISIYRDVNVAFGAQTQWVPELGRYIMQVFHSSSTSGVNDDFAHFGLFESENPWGPWQTIEYFSTFGSDLPVASCGGPCASINWYINDKWTADHGTTLWGVWSTNDVTHDRFNVLKATLTVTGGTTYHVTSNDVEGDGGAADNDGSCPNHGSVGVSFNTCAASITAGCTLAQPCCDIQEALDLATGSADIVEVHAGTYDAAIDGTTDVTIGADTHQVLAVVKACAGCTQEEDRRILRGAIISTQDFPTLKGTSSTEGAVWLGLSDDLENCKYVTIQSFAVTNFGKNLATNIRSWVMGGTESDHAYTVWDNLTMTALSTADEGETYPWFTFGEAFQGDFDQGHFPLLKNLTFSDDHRFMHNNTGGADAKCKPAGAIIVDTHFNITGPLAGGRTEYMSTQNVCGVWHRNFYDTHLYTNASSGQQTRAVLGPSFYFNNYFYLDGRAMHFQNNDANSDWQTWFIFNNTFYGWDAGALTQPALFTSGQCDMSDDTTATCVNDRGWDTTSRIVNNLYWKNDALDPTQQGTAFAIGGSHGFSAFKNNYCLNCPNGVETDLGSNVTMGSTNPVNGSGNFPTPWLQLSSGSTAMNAAGTNDPLGQGADVCSIDPVALWGCGDDNADGTCDTDEDCKLAEVCQVIDCSVDFDGDNRGTNWDIGADQFEAQAGGGATGSVLLGGTLTGVTIK